MADTEKPVCDDPTLDEPASDGPTPSGSASDNSDPGGIEAARVGPDAVRAAHCAICDQIVLVADDGGCPNGHPAEALGGFFTLAEGEPCPRLPRFNLAAFALPPVWGVFHGQWVGVLFVPIWVFVDSAASTASRGIVSLVGAVVLALFTVIFQVFFAKRANGVIWRNTAGHMSVDEFRRRQRLWAVFCVPLGIFVYAWMIHYRLVVA